MSVRKVGVLAVLGAAVVATTGLIACTASSEDEAGSGEEAIVQDRLVTVGRCRSAITLDPEEALPPAEQITQHRLRDVSREEVMTQADIVARIRTVRGGKRQIVELNARLGSLFSRGNATVTVASTAAQSTTLQLGTGKMEYQVRTLTAPPSGLVGAIAVNGAEPVALGVAVLQREPSTGRGWLLLGTHDDQLMAVASGCTFDERAWSVLADPSCEAPLYEDAGASPTCAVPVADAGVDAAVDAGPKADAATADASDDAATSDAAAEAPVVNPSEKKSTADEDPSGGEDGMENTPSDLPPDELPRAKKASQSSSGCSASPVSAAHENDSVLAAGFAALLALVASRMRRRAVTSR